TGNYTRSEQQGRLTLHLHLLLWVVNAMSPQEIRDKVIGPRTYFRRRLILYLESCHRAELFEGTTSSTAARKAKRNLTENVGSDSEPHIGHSQHQSPTHTLAMSPPPMCPDSKCDKTCPTCVRLGRWSLRYKKRLMTSFYARMNGCLTKSGVCRARFPRDVFEVSGVDEKGHINVRHMEPMMNTVSPLLTYVSRCNTDVTSLLSGTAVKAVVSYPFWQLD
ncbi:hypothetical protein B0H17DRAFT_948152, partial [Mycena rosella]